MKHSENVQAGPSRGPAETVHHAWHSAAEVPEALLLTLLERLKQQRAIVFRRTQNVTDRLAGRFLANPCALGSCPSDNPVATGGRRASLGSSCRTTRPAGGNGPRQPRAGYPGAQACHQVLRSLASGEFRASRWANRPGRGSASKGTFCGGRRSRASGQSSI